MMRLKNARLWKWVEAFALAAFVSDCIFIALLTAFSIYKTLKFCLG